jgi:agmatine deiminase
MKKENFLILISLLQVCVLGAQSPSNDHPFSSFSPSLQTRMVAEWEPAVGVLISWPPSIPHRLIQELAKDTKLHIIVPSRTMMQDAIVWLTKWGVYPDKVKFITAPSGVDVSWTRDWGPHAVFDTSKVMKLADARYIYSTPVSGYACDDSLQFLFYDTNGEIELTIADDRIPRNIAGSIDLDLIELPFAFTGGNVFSDGQQRGFSTCVIKNENEYLGIREDSFRAEVSKYLGITEYNILSNFEEHGIQHIDCYLKVLDEERLFVMRPPADHPASEVYEGILEYELSQLTNAFGRPYQILRLDTDVYGDEMYPDALAAYSNSLILNKTIYVPMFSIPQDTVALRQWREAMPGYTVKGFEFIVGSEPHLDPEVYRHYGRLGWQGGDALHCRTRAVWNPTMLYISVDRIPANVSKADAYPVDVILKDYSAGNLMEESLRLLWRVKGTEKWDNRQLLPTGVPDHFSASIPGGMAGVTIEYYIAARSYWGTKATMPRVVPEAYYEFKID